MVVCAWQPTPHFSPSSHSLLSQPSAFQNLVEYTQGADFAKGQEKLQSLHTRQLSRASKAVKQWKGPISPVLQLGGLCREEPETASMA